MSYARYSGNSPLSSICRLRPIWTPIWTWRNSSGIWPFMSFSGRRIWHRLPMSKLWNLRNPSWNCVLTWSGIPGRQRQVNRCEWRRFYRQGGRVLYQQRFWNQEDYQKERLTPEETAIICSAKTDNLRKLDNLSRETGMKFRIGDIPQRGEPHKMFTSVPQLYI